MKPLPPLAAGGPPLDLLDEPFGLDPADDPQATGSQRNLGVANGNGADEFHLLRVLPEVCKAAAGRLGAQS